MAAVLGTNIASIWASKNLQSAQTDMASSVERLSSGLRINRAKDDAAGLGIANALTQQINGANQGVRNLNDGISIVQTAEGAINAASEMAQRILTLATQGDNGSLGLDQKKSIESEIAKIMTSIQSIQDRTYFSGTKLLNAIAISIRSSSAASDTISIDDGALAKIYNVAASGITNALDTTLVADGTTVFATLASDAKTYITALDTQRGKLGALQNQMEYAVTNVTELSANLTAARSRVQDTDYASETASLTKGQILQQAATAMLAQANQMPNVILSLLK
jgi:flagellin